MQPFSPGDMVQTPQGEVGNVVKCQKKGGDGESVSNSSAFELTTSSGIPPTNSESTTTGMSTDNPANGADTTPGDMPKVFCKVSARVGTLAQGEDWENRVWVVWEGETEPEPVRIETLWKPGDRFYYLTGKPGEIIEIISSELIKVRFEKATANVNVRSSKIFIAPLEKKSVPAPVENDDRLGKLISLTKTLLEESGYEWEVIELPTDSEVKVKAIAAGKELGEIWFFPAKLLTKYYPNDGPAGGCSGDWCWTFTDNLFDYFDYEDRNTLDEIENLTISDIKMWQLLELPHDDINFKHYVGKHLVKQGIAADYKIDEVSLQLLVPENTNLTIALGEVDHLMENVNTHQKDIPAKGSDRLTQTELFPNWEEAS